MSEENSRLRELTKDFLNRATTLSGLYLASPDGLLMAHSSRITVDPDKVAAMIASLSAVGDRIMKELLDDESMHVVVQSRSGYIIIKKYGNIIVGAVVRAYDESVLGMALLEVEKFIDIIKDELIFKTKT
ncbi:roadblock/LC7 domain-containing protein [Vulcanisaeta thermophila]|uniref:roadblock/LC7 domain-containing protein n=1 Tax=Vulcanisaeta thermophila TaxID=867917 RepID=UPI000852E2DD|nr:roadblock/LC7 domain-containing protein [Vulcanisaeta thermophila]